MSNNAIFSVQKTEKDLEFDFQIDTCVAQIKNLGYSLEESRKMAVSYLKSAINLANLNLNVKFTKD